MDDLITFMFTPNTGYCGGCAIVVAHSALEAYGVLIKEREYYAGQVNIQPDVLSDLIPSKDIKAPQIIIDKIYIE